MKIGILGNMNNIYFSQARYLADEGFDCDLLIFDYEPSHFHPSADTFENNFGFTVRRLSWGDPGRFFGNSKQIRVDLAPYQFLIGSGTAPAFAHSINRNLDLFIPYGDDLYSFPFPRMVHPRRQLSYLAHAWHQRKGIQQCPNLLFDKTNPVFEKVFERIGYNRNRIISPLPLFYHKEYDAKLESGENDHPYNNLLKKLRGENDLLIVHHTRQVWKTRVDTWSQKGNDLLYEGLSHFVKAFPGIRVKLLLFDYGIDVAHSRALISRLGLDGHVQWFPKLHRKELLRIIKTGDLVIGELHHAWNSYCVVLEALSMGKPIMHKRDDTHLDPFYETLYPMFQAFSAKTVFEGLSNAINDKTALQEMGKEGRSWFLEYCVKRPMEEIRRLIVEKQKQLHVH